MKRDKKENQYFLILCKLLTKEKLLRPDFERPKKQITRFDEKINNELRKHIPHSTLINRLDELKELVSLIEIDTGNLSKRGLPLFSYSITSFGFVKLLSLCDPKNIPKEVSDSIQFYLPKISYNWDFLCELFDSKLLYETLIDVCKNLEIRIAVFNKNSTTPDPLFYVTAAELLTKKNFRILRISAKVENETSSYTLQKRFTVYESGRNNPPQFRFYKIEADLMNMVSVLFYHKLLVRCGNSNFKDYPTSGRILVKEIIKSETNLNEIYREFLSDISNEAGRELDFITTLQV